MARSSASGAPRSCAAALGQAAHHAPPRPRAVSSGPVSSTLSTTSRRRSDTRQAQRRKHTRHGRDHDAAHAELLGDGGGVQRPRAAEGHQRQLARVDAALHGHHPHRLRHLRVGHARDPGGRLLQREAQLAGQRRRSPARPPRGRAGHRPPAARPRAAGPARRFASVTVGRSAAAPVARGPGIGARRCGGPPAARRRRPPRRCCRRPRPRCARPPWAAPATGRRPRGRP